jgi:hypothetical protein
MPIEVWLDERTDGQRRAAEAVLEIVERIPGLIVEAVGVGILIKRVRTIVELRPKTKWLDMSICTPMMITSDRIARTLEYGKQYVYYVHLTDAADVDDEVAGWLATALDEAPAPRRVPRRTSAGSPRAATRSRRGRAGGAR